MKHQSSSPQTSSNDPVKQVKPACSEADVTTKHAPHLPRLAWLGAFILVAALILVVGVPWNPPTPVPHSFVYPVMAPRLSSNYGTRIHPIRRFSHQHSGIDLAAPYGSPIRAVAAGKVVFADPYAGYGNLVVVQHTPTLTTHYGHCSTIKVRTGQKVKAGEIIALVGSSGVSTGPHLHFEVRVNATPINPERLIPGLASEAEG